MVVLAARTTVWLLWWNALRLLAKALSASAAFGAPPSPGSSVSLPNTSVIDSVMYSWSERRRCHCHCHCRRSLLVLVPSNGELTVRLRCASNYDAEGEEEDDEDEPPPQPYGNRSLSWTQKYRQLLPYEYARKTAMKLGLRSRDEWDDYLADGKVYHGPYLPNRPDEMYADDWVSWEEFLGITRSYDETRHLVRNVLQLKSLEEYRAFVAADVQRAEGLRIPAQPDVVYRGKGWVSEEHFFNPL